MALQSGGVRQAVRDMAVAAAELDDDRAVGAGVGGYGIDGIGLLRVRREAAVGVVHAHRPEAVHRHVLQGQAIDGPAVVAVRRDVEEQGVFLRQAAPGGAGADQPPDRIARAAPPGEAPGVRQRLGEHCEAGAHVDLARRVPVGDGKRARAARLLDPDRILERANGVDVLRTVGVYEDAHRRQRIARADRLPAQRRGAGPVDDLDRVVVLIDDLHRDKALAGLRQRDRDGSGVEIEHRGRIKRVANLSA